MLADGTEHAVVELMGRQMIAGAVSEVLIAGVPMLRVDVPALPGIPAWHRLIGGSALYAVNPCDEETVLRVAGDYRLRPVALALVNQMSAPAALLDSPAGNYIPETDPVPAYTEYDGDSDDYIGQIGQSFTDDDYDDESDTDDMEDMTDEELDEYLMESIAVTESVTPSLFDQDEPGEADEVPDWLDFASDPDSDFDGEEGDDDGGERELTAV